MVRSRIIVLEGGESRGPTLGEGGGCSLGTISSWLGPISLGPTDPRISAHRSSVPGPNSIVPGHMPVTRLTLLASGDRASGGKGGNEPVHSGCKLSQERNAQGHVIMTPERLS